MCRNLIWGIAYVCNAPNQVPTHRAPIHCPLDCKMIELRKSEFEMKGNNTIKVVNSTSDSKVIFTYD